MIPANYQIFATGAQCQYLGGGRLVHTGSAISGGRVIKKYRKDPWQECFDNCTSTVKCGFITYQTSHDGYGKPEYACSYGSVTDDCPLVSPDGGTTSTVYKKGTSFLNKFACVWHHPCDLHLNPHGLNLSGNSLQ